MGYLWKWGAVGKPGIATTAGKPPHYGNGVPEQ
jgi:hypothetical protein